jgi:biotin carboxylase
MSNTVLVLGASAYQVPVIETARRLGYRVITTDNVPTNPGHSLSDESFDLDTTDLDAMLSLAKGQDIAGIIAPATDVAVVTASYVAQHLRLPGVPLKAASILSQKNQFREFLRVSDFPSPQAFLIANDEPPQGDLLQGGKKWLIKPNRSSGSKGVFIIQTVDEFQLYVRESRAFSVDRTAVLDEFVEGTQHTCEGILHEGRIALTLMTDRDTTPPPHTATTGHRVPSRLSKKMQAKAATMIEETFCRLAVTNGPFDCDFVAEGDRIFLIEIAPRLGGNSLSRLYHAALDYDLVAYAVRQACGDPAPIPERCEPKPMAVAILGVDRSGCLSWNESEASALRQEIWVNSLILDLPQGAPVEPFINGRRRVGEALITGTNRNQVDEQLTEFKRRLALTAV